MRNVVKSQRGFGIDLPSLFDEMQAIGTIECDVDPEVGLAAAIRGGVANRTIKAPAGFTHRYYQEDLWYGLGPFLALATIAGVETPCARSLMQLGELAAGPYAPGRSADGNRNGHRWPRQRRSTRICH